MYPKKPSNLVVDWEPRSNISGSRHLHDGPYRPCRYARSTLFSKIFFFISFRTVEVRAPAKTGPVAQVARAHP